jgi:membrane protease YdiL (CAAX protease family)
VAFKSRRDINLALIPLYYLILFDILRHLANPTHLECIVLDAGFIILVVCVFKRGSMLATVNDLFGRSSFKANGVRSWNYFLILVVATICLAKYFYSPPTFEFSLTQKCTLFLAGPFTEEACCRALFINTLSRVMPTWWVCLLNIFFWISVHELASRNLWTLVIPGIIFCCCFVRFRSIICCSILHSIWNIVV